MELNSELNPILETQIINVSPNWGARLAHPISTVFSPPLLSVATTLVVAGSLATTRAWLWAGAYILITVLGPVAFILWLVRRGEVSDFDLRQRDQRIRPYLFTLVCLSGMALVISLAGAPRILAALGWATAIQMALLMLITLRWKISLHTAAVAGTVAVLWNVWGTAAIWLLPIIPLVAWARLRLRCHTLSQTVAGTAVGLALTGVIMYLAG